MPAVVFLLNFVQSQLSGRRPLQEPYSAMTPPQAPENLVESRNDSYRSFVAKSSMVTRPLFWPRAHAQKVGSQAASSGSEP